MVRYVMKNRLLHFGMPVALVRNEKTWAILSYYGGLMCASFLIATVLPRDEQEE